MPLRLLYIARVGPCDPRPQSVQVLATACALARAGVGVTVVMDPPSSPMNLAEILAWHGETEVPGLRLWWPDGFHPSLRSLQKLRFLKGELARVGTVLTRDFKNLGRVASLAPSRVRRVLEWHALPSVLGEGTAAAEQRALEEASLHIAVSPLLAGELRHLSPAAQVEVVENGARILSHARERMEAWTPGRDAVHSGFLRRPQDVLPLLAVTERLPQGACLRMRGEAGAPGASPLSAPFSERVRFAGFSGPSDTDSFYDGAFCSLAPYEESPNTMAFASPLKVLEAHASGVPLVATDLPTVGALAENETDSLLVPPGDLPAFADAVLRLHGDRALGMRLAQAGWERARTRTWDHRAARLLPLLFPEGS